APEPWMLGVVPDATRVVAGASGSPGSLSAGRYAVTLARRNDAPLVAVLAWGPPGGGLADRRCPSTAPRPGGGARARGHLRDACGALPPARTIELVTTRGARARPRVGAAPSPGDLLVVGGARRSVLPWMGRGKVSRYSLSPARRPVLAAPHPATARELGLG